MTAKELITELSIDVKEPNSISGQVTPLQKEFAEENVYTLAEIAKKAIEQRDQALGNLHQVTLKLVRMLGKKMPEHIDVDAVIDMANVELDKLVEG